MSLLILMIVFILSYATSISANSNPPTSLSICPPIDQYTPLCPNSGVTILDETYPVQAYIISNLRNDIKLDLSVPVQFTNTVIESFSAKNFQNLPQIIFSSNEEKDFIKFRKIIMDLFEQKGTSKANLEKIFHNIVHRTPGSLTWQQDYFESFFSSSTGRPVLQKILTYDLKNNIKGTVGNVSDIMKVSQQCGVSEGLGLTSSNTPNSINTEMGGNIEGVPGGFCLVSRSMDDNFALQFCQKKENMIKINTSFLEVGHVDELFKIIPTFYHDKRPKECEFSLLAASPQKFLDVISSSEWRSRNIYEYDFYNSREEQNHYLNTRYSEDFLFKYVCKVIMTRSQSQTHTKMRNSKQSLTKSILSGIVPSANASVESIYDDCAILMKRMKNIDFFNKVKSYKGSYEDNMSIEKIINDEKKLIKEKILSRLPQCKEYIDSSSLDVPVWFSGSTKVLQTSELKDCNDCKKNPNGNFLSVWPNSINSVVMNKTLLFSEPENSAIREYMMTNLKTRGIEGTTIHLWEYAHLGRGGIHCASHSLPYCRPRP